MGFGGSPDEEGETTLDALIMDGVSGPSTKSSHNYPELVPLNTAELLLVLTPLVELTISRDTDLHGNRCCDRLEVHK